MGTASLSLWEVLQLSPFLALSTVYAYVSDRFVGSVFKELNLIVSRGSWRSIVQLKSVVAAKIAYDRPNL
jgi:hypothetical protein